MKDKRVILTFFTPRTFRDLFLRSLICFLDFSILVSKPFCRQSPRSVRAKPEATSLIVDLDARMLLLILHSLSSQDPPDTFRLTANPNQNNWKAGESFLFAIQVPGLVNALDLSQHLLLLFFSAVRLHSRPPQKCSSESTGFAPRAPFICYSTTCPPPSNAADLLTELQDFPRGS